MFFILHFTISAVAVTLPLVPSTHRQTLPQSTFQSCCKMLSSSCLFYRPAVRPAQFAVFSVMSFPSQGVDVSLKLSWLRSQLADDGCSCIMITKIDKIAWLLNLII
ncbi:uncharacterized protein [Spinacia oleracea]|uniref:Secreted protein n=1 Tax=Spinacia oleracea TaxID=3562 RepID=A0ABM3QYB0_SPIOL|nr:uncharacterized protein LOC110787330 [Spinacia oleracea]XP_056688369.1 uncharacterized protein LOC110787330 [Spinacia oleracea]